MILKMLHSILFKKMWLDELQPGDSWMGVWKMKYHCGNCYAIIDHDPCTVCGYIHQARIDPHDPDQRPSLTLMGAITNHTYVTLNLMQREWERPLLPEDTVSGLSGEDIPQRILVVILFWSLFENLMDRLFEAKLRSLPPKIAGHLKKRFSNISARMNEFYTLVFDVSFREDLHEEGFAGIYAHLCQLQERRNAFMHDDPTAVDQALIEQTVGHLQDIQTAWIALFNKHCAKTVS